MKFAWSGEVRIAYIDEGEGDPVLIGFPPLATCQDLYREEPRHDRMFARAASFCRHLRIDKRGTGLSDPVKRAPTLPERIDDVRAVMDVEGVERAVLWGQSEGGPLAVLFALTYPERTQALILSNTFVPGDPAVTAEMLDAFQKAVDAQFEKLLEQWGTAESIFTDWFYPSVADDEEFRRWSARMQRHACSQSMLRKIIEYNRALDAGFLWDQLEAISVPTLVTHTTGDRVIPVIAGRQLATRIPGARYAEFDSPDHGWVVSPNADEIMDLLEEFITGVPPRHSRNDRVLATVLLTDMVDSTARAAALGDRQWRAVLDQHDQLAHTTVEGYSGRLVKSTGDGVLALFDGPGRAIAAAIDLRDRLEVIGLPVRTGLHCGEVELRGDDIAGVSVHIASRIEELASASEILVSRTLKDLVLGSDFCFDSRGSHRLKGVADTWELFAVTS